VGKPGHFRSSLTLVVLACAVSHIALGLAPTVLAFTAAYAVASLARGAMLPATNTVIAASVPPERRGTVFGVAAGVQAFAFIIGPMSAALFATFSLDLGFVALGVALLLTAAITFAGLREPDLRSSARRPEEPEGREPATSRASA
jgi:DHA1 family multidrug resistance protein-like MFS transporter